MVAGLSFEDSLFEAVSGSTTTGLTTLSGLEELSPAFLFGRDWLQCYRGLAITPLAIAQMIGPGQVARRLDGGEAQAQDLVASTRVRSRRILTIYGALAAMRRMSRRALVNLELPGRWRALCLYRGTEALLPDGDTEVRAGDEVVLVTHQANIDRLTEYFRRQPEPTGKHRPGGG